jgi:hypothetical protein
MAEPAPPRYRFQFRLRTLLIGVTLLTMPCAYVGWQAKIVRHRKELIRHLVANGSYVGYDFAGEFEDSVPWVRRLMGDDSIRLIGLLGASVEERDEISAAFPEADVQRWLRIEAAY